MLSRHVSFGPLVYTAGLLLFTEAAQNVNVLIVTAIVGFLTVFVQQLFAAQSARRQHEWDVADRRAKAEEVRIQTDSQMKLISAQSEATQRQITLVLEQRANAIEERAAGAALVANATQRDVRASQRDITATQRDIRTTREEVSDMRMKIADNALRLESATLRLDTAEEEKKAAGPAKP